MPAARVAPRVAGFDTGVSLVRTTSDVDIDQEEESLTGSFCRSPEAPGEKEKGKDLTSNPSPAPAHGSVRRVLPARASPRSWSNQISLCSRGHRTGSNSNA